MTHIIPITDANHFNALTNQDKNFLLLKPTRAIKVGDTVVLQHGDVECYSTVTGGPASEEMECLRKDSMAITIKVKEVENG